MYIQIYEDANVRISWYQCQCLEYADHGLSIIRVVHSSDFWAIFSSFLCSFLISFFKKDSRMRSRMKQKMIIFQKSNHTNASTKIVHFYFPFSEPISSSAQTVVNHTSFPHIVPTNYTFPLSTHIQFYGTKDKKGCCPQASASFNCQMSLETLVKGHGIHQHSCSLL